MTPLARRINMHMKLATLVLLLFVFGCAPGNRDREESQGDSENAEAIAGKPADELDTQESIDNANFAIARFQSQAIGKLPKHLTSEQRAFVLGKIRDRDHLYAEQMKCEAYYQGLISSFSPDEWPQFILFGDLDGLRGHEVDCWAVRSSGGFSDEIGGCVDAKTGKLLILLTLPEG